MRTTNSVKRAKGGRRNTALDHLTQLLIKGDIEGFRSAMKRVYTEDDRSRSSSLPDPTDAEITLALLEGRYRDIGRLTSEPRRVADTLPLESDPSGRRIKMFTLLREQGRLDVIANAYSKFTSDGLVCAIWRPALAVLLAEIGLLDDAKREFQRLAANDFSDIPRNGLWFTALSYLAEVCIRVGTAHDAARLYTLLEPMDGYNIVASNAAVCYGSAARYLGLLATQLPRLDVAERHFQAALAMNSHLQAQPYLAHTQHAYAAMLMSRQAERDDQTARGLLRESGDTARKLGMATLLNRLQSQPLFDGQKSDADLNSQ